MSGLYSPRLILLFGCCLLLVAACGGQGASLPGTPLSAVPVTEVEPGASVTPPDGLEQVSEAEELFDARQRMVAQTIENRGVENPDVLRAMRAVPRHEFVPADYLSMAYADHPLPIGYGQTISQPYIVAWMTELLDLKPGEAVLEIGTGSGYQAAVLAELGFVQVYSIEIVPELAERAAADLDRLGYQVQVKPGDGYYGWPEHAPFDAIIVTAAPDHLPAPLVEQLAPGGCIVIPIGPRGGIQSLWKFVQEEGELKAYNVGGVRFVPFTGEGIESGE
jgi:protein-L-isoaspartate(D-aspartate) O-methyltransferase